MRLQPSGRHLLEASLVDLGLEVLLDRELTLPELRASRRAVKKILDQSII